MPIVIPADRRPDPTPERRFLRDDTKIAAGKIAFFQYVSVAVFLFLLAGFWDLQVRNEEVYLEQAERNQIKSLPVRAPRGKIFDRENRLIVDNHSSYDLLLSRETFREEHIHGIAQGLGLDEEDLAAELRRYRSAPKYRAITIKRDLSRVDLTFVESHRGRDAFPELELVSAQQRIYPLDGLAAHLLGYVGEINETELNSPEWAKHEPGDIIGKAGAERTFNEQITGRDGRRQVRVDVHNRQREELGLVPAEPGKSLQLTIDLDLQAVAELAMENRRGAVVALDPRNGEVLAMVSRPAFDPNHFTGRIAAREWARLLNDPEKPLYNRAIQAQFAPGSTFKPILALAALESGTIDENFTVHCAGSASFYGRPFKCHLKGGHGTVNLHKAIVQSCDVYFYTVGNKLGIDKIAEYAELAGLGKKTGVDLPGENQGVVPSSRWKIRNFREKWYAGETISVAIGQGALTVTPIQLAAAIGGIATGGVWMKPHLIREQNPPEPVRKAELKLENVMRVINGMYGVVNEGGTGARSRIPGLEFCGKTGSAQLASNELAKSGKLGADMKDNAWFVGFAPRQSPEIVVAALFENGVHGDLAAPIVRDVIKAYFDKKARQTPPQQQVARQIGFVPHFSGGR